MTSGCSCERRRVFHGAGAAIPALLVALLPKCPMCLAAWIAAGTGIGISAGSASWLLVLAVTLGVAPLVYVSIRHWKANGTAPFGHGSET